MNPSPRFSLIVATVGRAAEFSYFLESLARQEMRDFELIVVDQNSDDRLLRIIDDWLAQESNRPDHSRKPISVIHLRAEKGLSKARNLGLSYSRGQILAFPDDDCWYQPDTLKNVDDWFKEHHQYGILSLGCRDLTGRVSSNPWWQKQCDINRINAYKTTATFCYFVRRPADGIPVQFDESLGPGAGTIYGCGEDCDLVLTLMRQGIKARFCATPFVGHPFKNGLSNATRARSYGGGFGRVLSKHSQPILFVGFVAFDVLRAIAHNLFGHRDRAAQLWAHAAGMIDAFFPTRNRLRLDENGSRFPK